MDTQDKGVGALVWSPLGWGKLTGKIRRDQPAKPGTRAHDIAGTGPHFDEERLFTIVDALLVIAKETAKMVSFSVRNRRTGTAPVSSVTRFQ